MKNITRKLFVVLIAVVMAFSALSLAACNDEPSTTYTVKVVGPDGNPYTAALVQPCVVEADGELGACYPGVATDSNGVAVLEIGKSIPSESTDLIEVHLLELPPYLTYTAPRIRRGDDVTITLSVKTEAQLDKPKSGNGTGGYYPDPVLGDLGDHVFRCDPFVVGEGAYALKFTAADQKIYFAFESDYEAIYKVYSFGDIDVSVTQYFGTTMTGLHSGGAEYHHDNISATDKNFSLEFEVSPENIIQNNNMGVCYFEIALENADDVNKSGIVCFEYVDEYQKKTDDVVDVTPAVALTSYANQANSVFVDVDLLSTGECKKGNDGYYYIGDNRIIAVLGNETSGPRGLDGLSFIKIYEQGQLLSFKVDGVVKNYLPLVTAYTDAANDAGHYPLTDELIDFFTVYMNVTNAVASLQSKLSTVLPVGQEWLVWCGYYELAPEGSKLNPIPLEDGDNSITVPAAGEIYYSYSPIVNMTLTLSSQSANVSLKLYSAVDDEQDAENVKSSADGFTHTVDISARDYYYFVFSAKDGAAATYTVNLEATPTPAELGSSENPIKIENIDGVKTFIVNITSGGDEVYYYYEVGASEETLYFSWTAGTVVTIEYVNVMNDGTEVPVQRKSTLSDEAATLKGGLAVPAGKVLRIWIGSANSSAGEISFSVSNAAITE